jgi:hypothetical protein
MADETPQEHEALAKLDETTREIVWEEADANPSQFAPIMRGRDWRNWLPSRLWRNPEPTDERGLRDALHRDADKQ